MKTKLNMKQLAVLSFVTTLKQDEKQTAIGGKPTAYGLYAAATGGAICSMDCGFETHNQWCPGGTANFTCQ